MKAIEAIKERRSVRKYKEEKVDRSLLKEIIDISRWSPSWANYQIARYTVVDNDNMIQEIYQRGVQGFSYNMKTLKNAQGVMVLSYVIGQSGSLDGKGFSTSKGNNWEMFDAGIACQTFCLAAHAKGLGTCIFGVIDDQAIAEIINLPSNQRVASIITYGFEVGEHAAPTPRKEVEELMTIAGE